MSKELGHEVSILNEATKEGNRSIEELKRQSATERLQEATEKASKIVSKAQTQAQTINDSLIAVKAEYEAKKAYVREADKVSQVSMMYPAEAKVTEKGLIHKQKFVTVPAEMWEAKHISANEKGYLQKANEALNPTCRSSAAQPHRRTSERCSVEFRNWRKKTTTAEREPKPAE